MSLLDTLKALDPTDDSLWTDDGLPTLDAVKAITGDKKLTRQALNDVALGLTRTNVTEYVNAPSPAEPETPVVEVVEQVVVEEENKAEQEYQAAISLYHETAIRERQEKAAKVQAFKESGFTLEDVLLVFPHLRK